jgi:multiple sugar transport system permease protein
VFVSVHRRLIGSSSINLLPDFTRLGVFTDALADGQVVGWLLDSLIVATGTTVLSIALGVPLGYALSRFAFRGKAAGGLALLFTQMLPEALLVVALILKGAIDGVPRELDEAARVDGSRPPTVLARIILPLIAPAIAAAAVIAFFSAWNEYVFAATIQTIMAVGLLFTLPAVAFYLFAQRYVVSGMTAGAVKG